MNHINIKDRTYTWDKRPNMIYSFYHVVGGPHALFLYSKDIIFYNQIIDSGWDKQDFIDAIECWESMGYTDPDIKNLKQNLDKYLYEAMIKNIIE